MSVIGTGQKYSPGDFYIETPDNKLRLCFQTKEAQDEARAFMENVYAAGECIGSNRASNRLFTIKDSLKEHIESCEDFLTALEQA